jgi:hypothetical protein
VTLVCLPAEAEAINAEGIRVHLPVKGRKESVAIDSRSLPGELAATGPLALDPADYDLVCLAMQEPQYRSAAVRELLEKVARSNVPCMSIMNMPPLPFLLRIPGVEPAWIEHAYSDATVWQGFDPELMTLCSPDPQAFRPPEEKANVLRVTLATNFKVARFDAEPHTAMLRRLAVDIEAIRFDAGDAKIELPVKLKVHESIFVPLAKWAMLLTGNYRCITRAGARSISEAVNADIAESRAVYYWVREVCLALGAASRDLVPFEKYAAAAAGLVRPSSAARALYAGATNIEGVDRLVQALAARKGMRNAVVEETVRLVDEKVAENRRAAPSPP